MLRHVVMFVWKPGTTPDQVAAARTGLATMPGQIPEIARYRFGPDTGLASSNWDFVVVADFADATAYEGYRDHPAHQQLIADVLAPIIADRAAVQYQLED